MDDVPFVAVGADEYDDPPWGGDRSCPLCGEKDLPLQRSTTTDKTDPDAPDIVLQYISHCGQSWLRGPILRETPRGG